MGKWRNVLWKTEVNVVANIPDYIINLVNFFLVIVTLNKIKFSFYNGEFDPGSGLTLAAGLIHASRTVTGPAMDADEWRTGA